MEINPFWKRLNAVCDHKMHTSPPAVALRQTTIAMFLSFDDVLSTSLLFAPPFRSEMCKVCDLKEDDYKKLIQLTDSIRRMDSSSTARLVNELYDLTHHARVKHYINHLVFPLSAPVVQASDLKQLSPTTPCTVQRLQTLRMMYPEDTIRDMRETRHYQLARRIRQGLAGWREMVKNHPSSLYYFSQCLTPCRFSELAEPEFLSYYTLWGVHPILLQ